MFDISWHISEVNSWKQHSYAAHVTPQMSNKLKVIFQGLRKLVKRVFGCLFDKTELVFLFIIGMLNHLCFLCLLNLQQHFYIMFMQNMVKQIESF